MPSINGLRGTGDWATDERPKNFRETILFRQPNGMAPLTALLSKMSDESTDDPEFAWWEEELKAIRVQETTGLASNSGSTTVTASGGGLYDLVAGDLLLVEKADQATYDNEVVKVTAIASDTSATITRAYAGTLAAIPANAFLTKIGNVFSEGSGAPSASSRNPTKLLNYTQIFKTVYDITASAAVTKTRTGNPVQNDKKRKMFDHSVALEMAFLFGRKKETTGSNGKPERSTGGLREFITSNVTVFSTTPTITTLLAALTPMFNFNSGAGDERIAFLGNGAANALNLLVANANNVRMQIGDTVKVYGMNFQKLIIPQGTIYFKTHPLLNTHLRYTNSMFVVDPSSMKYRCLTGRDTNFKDHIEGNDEDRQKGQWMTECGLEFHHEKTMAYLGNFTYP